MVWDQATAGAAVVHVGPWISISKGIPVKEVRDEMIATIEKKNCQNAKGAYVRCEVIQEDFSNFRPERQ